MVVRLWVPLIHRLVARNWNLAISGLPLTASRVANSVAVSTPLNIGVSVVVMSSISFEAVGGSVSWRHADTVLRGRARDIRADHGSATDSPRISIGEMAESERLSQAGVSDREAEVLELLGEHLTNAQIARR